MAKECRRVGDYLKHLS
jgi:hypothetical protein